MSYIFETSVIRFKEKLLLTKQELLDMLKMSYEECVNYIKSKGIKTEVESDVISSLGESFKVLLLVENDINNLKATVKAVCLNTEPEDVFLEGSIDPMVLYNSVKENNFYNLPFYLQNIAKTALNTLVKTKSPEKADEAVDKLFVDYISYLKSKTADEGIKLYADYIINKMNSNIFARSGEEKIALKDSYKFFNDNVDSSLPIISYLIRKDRENSIIKLILTSLKNNFDTDLIKKRIESVYG